MKAEINDIDLTRWKEYEHIWTHSLWVGKYRKQFLKNCGSRKFHGNFIPEIPYQMMLRYTRCGEWVLDPMAGSGTTGDVAKFLGRNCDMFDLNPVRSDIKKADVLTYDYGKKYDLIILHPPYSNIIKFSDDGNDLSLLYWENFLDKFCVLCSNVDKFLKKNRYLILVCGEIYCAGEEIPLGFYCSDILRKIGYLRKAIIVKDYGETKGGDKNLNKGLMRYRHLKHGTWEFCGDFIFVMRKL